MVLVRMPIIGTGKTTDPFTVALPTWNCVLPDDGSGRMIVDIPDSDAPPNLPAPGTVRRPLITGLPVLTQVLAADRTAWIAKVSARYAGAITPANIDAV